MLKLLLALLISSSAHAYIVVSDVDDTLKITNSGNTAQAAWAGLFKNDVFPGMPEMFKFWREDNAKIYFVTASPTIIGGKIRELLAHYKISYESLTLRNNLLESKLRYKVRAISKILDQEPNEEVILIGDDVGQDPEVFDALALKYPGRVLISYVRPVKHRTLLPGQVPYVTVFDLATEERSQGRVAFEAIVASSLAVLKGDKDKLFPKFAWCPTEFDGSGLPTDTSPYASAAAIEYRIEKICRERQSGIENLH